jgi:hypothetical protein
METNEILAPLKKAIEALITIDDGEGESVTMTPDQFLSYAFDQVSKAADEEGDARRNRMAHLLKNMALVEKNSAFDGAGAAIKLYSGELSKQGQTASQEKSGKTISFEAACGKKPGSQFAADAHSGMGKGGFSFRGKVGKAATDEFMSAVAPMFKKHDLRETLMDELRGMLDDPAEGVEKADKSDEPAPEKTEKAKESHVWPRDLNADTVDKENDFGADPKQG